MDSRSDPGKRTKERMGLRPRGRDKSPHLSSAAYSVPFFLLPLRSRDCWSGSKYTSKLSGTTHGGVRRREQWNWLETASGKRRDKVSSNQMGSISRGSPPRPAAESLVYTALFAAADCLRDARTSLNFIRYRDPKVAKQISMPCIFRSSWNLFCSSNNKLKCAIIFIFNIFIHIYLLVHIFVKFVWLIYRIVFLNEYKLIDKIICYTFVILLFFLRNANIFIIYNLYNCLEKCIGRVT